MDRGRNFIAVFLIAIGRYTYRSIFALFKLFFNLLKWFFSLRLPRVKLPTISPPHLTLPKVSLPSYSFPHLPKLSLPALQFPKLTPIKKVFVSLLVVCFLLFYWFILRGLPSATSLSTRQPTLSTKIYDRHGQLLFTFYKDQNRSLIDLQDIPDHFIKATLAIEDSQFYKHNGFSYRGIIRSLGQIIFNQELQGGSTITQQLIKNALLSQERTINRKLKELILSLEVELLYSKDEILEMYFNEVSYGGVAFGAEQASQTYFGKSIREVNLAEAALLAGLPAAPTTYSPFGANPYLSIQRQHQVLNRMVEDQHIAPQEAALAKQQKITLAPQTKNIKAPHFVMYIKDLLDAQYGQTMTEQGGLSVITSLDLAIQEKTQAIVTAEINQVFPLHITNGAALVTNPKTGEILAMVGSRDYFDTERDGNVNVTTRLRQPGSSIKPVNYAVALESGFTAATIIQDTPVSYNLPGTTPYSPVNYDGRFHGPVTLRSALANSYNIPAVKTLASFGVDKMIAKGQQMGITTWTEPERYGLSLTLGGAEVTMTDMAVVYGTLANQGLKVNLHPILKVTNSNHKVLQDYSCDDISKIIPVSLSQPAQAATQHLNCNPDPVLNPLAAYILTDILSDPFARAPAFGTRSFLNIPNHQVAVKTGTTNDKRDNWTIGYTTDQVVVVWVGNNDNSPMSQVASGITGASPIWNKIMLELLRDQPAHKFIAPANLIQVQVCTITGQLSCNGCPSRTEYFVEGSQPKTHCSEEQIKQILEQRAQKEQEERDRLLTGSSTPR